MKIIYFSLALFFCTQNGLAIAPTTVTITDAKNLAKELLSNLSGEFSLNPEQMEKLGRFDVPRMQNGNWVLSHQPVSLVENFTEKKKAVAALFVKIGPEFVVVSASLGNGGGGDIVGTALDHNNPAYASLINGKRFTGEISLLGRKYMADYDLFKSKQGQVVGAYFVAIPLKGRTATPDSLEAGARAIPSIPVPLSEPSHAREDAEVISLQSFK